MLSISDRVKAIFAKKEYTPILILEIEGLPIVSSGPVKKSLNFDDPSFVLDGGFTFDSLITDKAILQIVDLKGSSNSFTQRIDQQRSSTSATNFTVNLVDKYGLVTQWITPGFVISDILGRKAKIYLSVVGASHPSDSVILMNGFVDGESSGQSTVTLSISSAEKLKQSTIFNQTTTALREYPAFSTTLSADLGAGLGDLNVVDSSGFPPAGPSGNRLVIQVGSDLLTYEGVGSGVLYYFGRSDYRPGFPTHAAYPAGTTVTLYHSMLPRTDSISDSELYINVLDTSGFIDPLGLNNFAYVKIDNEIIGYQSISGNLLVSVARGQLGTTPSAHGFGASVTSLYRITGSMKDLSLGLMLSGKLGPYYSTGYTQQIVTSSAGTIPNSIWIDDNYFEERGIVIGDRVILNSFYVDLAGVNNYFNLGGGYITSMGRQNGQAFIVINGPNLTAQSNIQLEIISKYNVFPPGAGLGLTPDLVDVAKHEFINSTYFGQLLNYDFQINSSVTGSDFINQQIYRPTGCFPLPSAGQASVGIVSAPVIADNIVTLNESNIVNASQIKRTRTVSKNFYNAIVIKYGLDHNTGNYTAGDIFFSNLSLNRIKYPTIPYDITADGVSYSAGTRTQLETIAKGLLTRYQYGAELFENVVLPASVGTLLQAGDIVVFDGADLNISDIAKINGTRKFKPRYMEIVDKQENPWQNSIVLKLLDTSYSIDGRYGTIAPASYVSAGSTNRIVQVQSSFETLLSTNDETAKWKKWVGQTIAVRSQDWTNYGEATISYLKAGQIILTSSLSYTPSAGDVMELPKYGTGTDPNVNAKAKKNCPYLNPSVSIIGISTGQDRFPVSGGDAAKFVVGAIVMVHSPDYSKVSPELTVSSISGTTVILNSKLGFSVDATMTVELIGFNDGGLPYRWA